MWSPIDSHSVAPLRKPRVFSQNDQQETSQTRLFKALNPSQSATLEHQQGVRDQKMDSAAKAYSDIQDVCSISSDDGISTARMRIKPVKKRNTQLMRSVKNTVTPSHPVAAVAKLLAGMTGLSIQMAGQKSQPNITININCEFPAPTKMQDKSTALTAKAKKAQQMKAETGVKPTGHESFAYDVLMQNEGFVVPGSKPSKPPSPAKPIKGTVSCPKIPKRTTADLPPNPAQEDPSVLLAYMRPQTRYEDLGSHGDAQDVCHAASVLVDGTVYEGWGRSKKLARKSAAALACRALFGIVFTGRFQN